MIQFGWTTGRWGVKALDRDDHRRVIALDHGGFDIAYRVRSAADAHLIAAAPQLYTALSELLAASDRFADRWAYDAEGKALAEAAHHALSVARGQQSS